MNVRPLFHYDDTIQPEELIQFLDVPASDPKKRAFLDACKRNPKLARAWSRTQNLSKAGSSIHNYAPSVDIRNQILQQARAHAQSEAFQQATNKSQTHSADLNQGNSKVSVLRRAKDIFGTSTMKYAWKFSAAAAFLALSMTVYFQYETINSNNTMTYDLVAQVENLDDDLYQLEQDLEILSMSMGLTNYQASGG